MTRPARFPLRPGKPLVFRRPNGAWGYACICAGHNSPRRESKPTSVDRHNCNTWAQAVREALDHVALYHKTPADRETEELEALYALPATERTTR